MEFSKVHLVLMDSTKFMKGKILDTSFYSYF